MTPSKAAFIQMALDNNVLKFGDFTLKSGRKSPYFFNAGEFYQNIALKQLGQAYANAIIDSQIDFKHLFGPAYKGLPLATTTAIALAERGINTSVTFNRKEIKQHGEGGVLMGAPLTGNTVIIDDVITAGTAFHESKRLIEENGGKVTAVVIAIDRCERGVSEKSTLQDIESQGVRVISIITLYDLMDYLRHQGDEETVLKITQYLKQYGCSRTPL